MSLQFGKRYYVGNFYVQKFVRGLSSKELKKIEFLESKDKFAYLNSVRTQGGGLNYKENLEFKKLYNSIKSKYPNLSHQEILLRVRSARLEKERREKDLNLVGTSLNSEIIQTANKLIDSVKKDEANSQETVFKVNEGSDNFKSFEDFLFHSYDSREGIVEEYSGKDSIEGYTGV